MSGKFNKSSQVPFERKNRSRFVLVWTAKEHQLLASLKASLQTDNNVKVKLVCTGDGGERVDLGKTVQDVVGQSSGKALVVACGPGTFCDEARKAVVMVVRDGKVDLDYHEEQLAW